MYVFPQFSDACAYISHRYIIHALVCGGRGLCLILCMCYTYNYWPANEFLSMYTTLIRSLLCFSALKLPGVVHRGWSQDEISHHSYCSTCFLDHVRYWVSEYASDRTTKNDSRRFLNDCKPPDHKIYDFSLETSTRMVQANKSSLKFATEKCVEKSLKKTSQGWRGIFFWGGGGKYWPINIGFLIKISI